MPCHCLSILACRCATNASRVLDEAPAAASRRRDQRLMGRGIPNAPGSISFSRLTLRNMRGRTKYASSAPGDGAYSNWAGSALPGWPWLTSPASGPAVRCLLHVLPRIPTFPFGFLLTSPIEVLIGPTPAQLEISAGAVQGILRRLCPEPPDPRDRAGRSGSGPASGCGSFREPFDHGCGGEHPAA